MEVTATVWCDGSALGNPGPAGIGVVVEALGRRRSISRSLGTATNNQAEYIALIEGLRAARATGATEVLVRTDSQLVVEQMMGRYAVRDPVLQHLVRLAHEEARGLQVRYEHVPRERNAVADRLARRAARNAVSLMPGKEVVPRKTDP